MVRHFLEWSGAKEDNGIRMFYNKEDADKLYYEKCFKYKKLQHGKNSEEETYYENGRNKRFLIDKDNDHLAMVTLAEYSVE